MVANLVNERMKGIDGALRFVTGSVWTRLESWSNQSLYNLYARENMFKPTQKRRNNLFFVFHYLRQF